MAGAFSGHLLNAYNSTASSSAPPIVTSGAMSFDARMHGAAGHPFFSPSPMPHSLFGFTPLSDDSTAAKQIAALQAKLNKKLGPEYISQRPGPGGGPKLTYAEGWKIINLANEVFGFNGWSSNIVNITTDFVDCIEESRRFNVGVTAIVRVTLRDGTYHEDVGYGLLENSKSKAAALDKCKKEAITDALKRTLRNFGNLLGNCLYDKSYAQEVVKIKVPPARFDKNELHRRPEFEERVPGPPAPRGQAARAEPSSTENEQPHIKVENEGHQPETPIAYVPRHLRQEIAATAAQQAQTPVRGVSTPLASLGVPSRLHAHTSTSGTPGGALISKSNGLVTPIQTPMQAPLSRAPLLRAVATSPLARMCSGSFSEPIPAPAQDGPGSENKMEDNGRGNGAGDDDDDAFPLSTQDGALFATVDLGDGDLGRPIDFEEGIGSVSEMDMSMLEQEPESPAVLPQPHPQPQHQVRDGIGNERTTSGGPSKTNTLNEVQVRPVAVESPNGVASASTPSTSSTPAQPDIERAVTTSIGGFHLPPALPPSLQKQAQYHTPKHVMQACVQTHSNFAAQGVPTGALKRNADAMQASAGSSTSASTSARPPVQGMGLAQRQQQQPQNISGRRSLENNDGNDLKRLKR